MNSLEAIIELRRSLARAAAVIFTGEINARQAAILKEIRKSSPISQVCLARATASDPSLIVRALDDLEKRGLVLRQRSATDRREMTLSLTAQGRAALGPLDAASRRLAEATEGCLSKEERVAFVALAGRMTRSLASITTDNVSSEQQNELG